MKTGPRGPTTGPTRTTSAIDIGHHAALSLTHCDYAEHARAWAASRTRRAGGDGMRDPGRLRRWRQQSTPLSEAAEPEGYRVGRTIQWPGGRRRDHGQLEDSLQRQGVNPESARPRARRVAASGICGGRSQDILWSGSDWVDRDRQLSDHYVAVSGHSALQGPAARHTATEEPGGHRGLPRRRLEGWHHEFLRAGKAGGFEYRAPGARCLPELAAWPMRSRPQLA